ncbi:MAG: hypothetical protein Kow00109_06100 [Acidobacteriota bacterium]
MFGWSKPKKRRLEHRILFRDWSELEPPESWEEPALGALVTVLRDYGTNSFDLGEWSAEDVEERCRRWVEHLLQGEAPPTNGGGAEGPAWNALTRDFRRLRRDEKEAVVTRVKGLQELVWDFIHRLGESVKDERSSNAGIRRQLQTLEESAQTADLGQLRKLIGRVVGEVRRAMQEREERQRRELARLGEHLRKLRTELQEARRQMAQDPLTRLFNRSAFEAHLRRCAELASLSASGTALFIIDADDFKSINDTYGHQAGDAALRRIADACVATFPRGNDFVARYGGDEFVIVMEDASLSTALQLAQRLMDNVKSSPLTWGDERIPLSVTVGLALIELGETAEQWFERADRALRSAKRQGKGSVGLAESDAEETKERAPLQPRV